MPARTDAPPLLLIRGGLIYRLERWLGWVDESRFSVRKRVLAFWCLTWVPIVILELIRLAGTHAPGPVPALYHDLRMNVHFLFSASLLLVADVVVDRRLNRTISQVLKRGIIQDRNRLNAMVTHANERISGFGGLAVEAGLLVLSVAVVSYGAWKQTMGPLLNLNLLSRGGGIPAAVYWYEWVALPLFHFVQLRWIWRFIVWLGLLWQLSKIRLHLVVTHPDLVGGLGVLAFAQESFALLWIAISGGAASTVAFRVMEEGKPLQLYYLPIGVFVGIEVLLLLAPLMLFLPQLAIARREGLLDYGNLSSQYVRLFDRKWVRHDPVQTDESLLGTSDIQSLAGLGNSFDRVRKMRLFPAEKISVMRIVFAGALPFLPLVFLVARVEDVLRAAIKLFL